MLFGAHPYDECDNDMQVGVAYNYFAPGLIERTPRFVHPHVWLAPLLAFAISFLPFHLVSPSTK